MDQQADASEPEDGEIVEESEGLVGSGAECEYNNSVDSIDKRSSRTKKNKSSHHRSNSDQHHGSKYRKRSQGNVENRTYNPGRSTTGGSGSRGSHVYTGYKTRFVNSSRSRRSPGPVERTRRLSTQGSIKLKRSSRSTKKEKTKHGKELHSKKRKKVHGDNGNNQLEKRRQKHQRKQTQTSEHRRDDGLASRNSRQLFADRRNEISSVQRADFLAIQTSSKGSTLPKIEFLHRSGTNNVAQQLQSNTAETEPVSDDDTSVEVIPDEEVAAGKKSPLIITLDTTDTSEDDADVKTNDNLMKKVKGDNTNETSDTRVNITIGTVEQQLPQENSHKHNGGVGRTWDANVQLSPGPSVASGSRVDVVANIIGPDSLLGNSDRAGNKENLLESCDDNQNGDSSEVEEDMDVLELRNRLLAELVEKAQSDEQACVTTLNEEDVRNILDTSVKNRLIAKSPSSDDDDQDEEENALRAVLLSQIAIKNKRKLASLRNDTSTERAKNDSHVGRCLTVKESPHPLRLSSGHSNYSHSTRQEGKHHVSSSATTSKETLETTRQSNASSPTPRRSRSSARHCRPRVICHKKRNKSGSHIIQPSQISPVTGFETQHHRLARLGMESLRNPVHVINRPANIKNLPDNDLRNKLLRNRRTEQLQLQDTNALVSLFPDFGVADTDMRPDVGLRLADAAADMTIKRTVNFDSKSSTSTTTSSSAITYMAPINIDIPSDKVPRLNQGHIRSRINNEAAHHSPYSQPTSPRFPVPLYQVSQNSTNERKDLENQLSSSAVISPQRLQSQPDNPFRTADPFGFSSQSLGISDTYRSPGLIIPVPSIRVHPYEYVPVDVDHRVNQQMGLPVFLSGNPPEIHGSVVRNSNTGSQISPVHSNLYLPLHHLPKRVTQDLLTATSHQSVVRGPDVKFTSPTFAQTTITTTATTTPAIISQQLLTNNRMLNSVKAETRPLSVSNINVITEVRTQLFPSLTTSPANSHNSFQCTYTLPGQIVSVAENHQTNFIHPMKNLEAGPEKVGENGRIAANTVRCSISTSTMLTSASCASMKESKPSPTSSVAKIGTSPSSSKTRSSESNLITLTPSHKSRTQKVDSTSTNSTSGIKSPSVTSRTSSMSKCRTTISGPKLCTATSNLESRKSTSGLRSRTLTSSSVSSTAVSAPASNTSASCPVSSTAALGLVSSTSISGSKSNPAFSGPVCSTSTLGLESKRTTVALGSVSSVSCTVPSASNSESNTSTLVSTPGTITDYANLKPASDTTCDGISSCSTLDGSKSVSTFQKSTTDLASQKLIIAATTTNTLCFTSGKLVPSCVSKKSTSDSIFDDNLIPDPANEKSTSLSPDEPKSLSTLEILVSSCIREKSTKGSTCSTLSDPTTSTGLKLDVSTSSLGPSTSESSLCDIPSTRENINPSTSTSVIVIAKPSDVSCVSTTSLVVTSAAENSVATMSMPDQNIDNEASTSGTHMSKSIPRTESSKHGFNNTTMATLVSDLRVDTLNAAPNTATSSIGTDISNAGLDKLTSKVGSVTMVSNIEHSTNSTYCISDNGVSNFNTRSFSTSTNTSNNDPVLTNTSSIVNETLNSGLLMCVVPNHVNMPSSNVTDEKNTKEPHIEQDSSEALVDVSCQSLSSCALATTNEDTLPPTTTINTLGQTTLTRSSDSPRHIANMANEECCASEILIPTSTITSLTVPSLSTMDDNKSPAQVPVSCMKTASEVQDSVNITASISSNNRKVLVTASSEAICNLKESTNSPITSNKEDTRSTINNPVTCAVSDKEGSPVHVIIGHMNAKSIKSPQMQNTPSSSPRSHNLLSPNASTKDGTQIPSPKAKELSVKNSPLLEICAAVPSRQYTHGSQTKAKNVSGTRIDLMPNVPIKRSTVDEKRQAVLNSIEKLSIQYPNVPILTIPRMQPTVQLRQIALQNCSSVSQEKASTATIKSGECSPVLIKRSPQKEQTKCLPKVSTKQPSPARTKPNIASRQKAVVPIVVPVADGDTTDDEEDEGKKKERFSREKGGKTDCGSGNTKNSIASTSQTPTHVSSDPSGPGFQNFLEEFLRNIRKNVDKMESERSIGSKKVKIVQYDPAETEQLQSRNSIGCHESGNNENSGRSAKKTGTPSSVVNIDSGNEIIIKPPPSTERNQLQPIKTMNAVHLVVSENFENKMAKNKDIAIAPFRKRQGNSVVNAVIAKKKLETHGTHAVNTSVDARGGTPCLQTVLSTSTTGSTSVTPVDNSAHSKTVIEGLTKRVTETIDQVQLSFKEKELLQTRQHCYDEYRGILRDLQQHTRLINFDNKLGQDIAELENKLAAMKKRRTTVQLKATDLNKNMREKAKSALTRKRSCLALTSVVKKLGDKIIGEKIYKVPEILVENINELIRSMKAMDSKQSQDLQRDRGATFKQLVLDEGSFCSISQGTKKSNSNPIPLTVAQILPSIATSTHVPLQDLHIQQRSSTPSSSKGISDITKPHGERESDKKDQCSTDIKKTQGPSHSSGNETRETLTFLTKCGSANTENMEEVEPKVVSEERLSLAENDLLTTGVSHSIKQLNRGNQNSASIIRALDTHGTQYLDPLMPICPASLTEGICTKEGCTLQHL